MVEQAQTATHKVHFGWLSLLLIIFIEGFVSISVEILTIRQLVPVVGNSVIVTSLVIGIFLLFLALGYYRGGYYRDNYTQVLKRNFSISAVILGFGLCYWIILHLFNLISILVSDHSLITLLVYLLLVTAPLIYILGQTVPITTNLFKFEHHVGTISGKVLFLSTLGSFAGAVITALVLMNFFGVAWTVMINFIALVAILLMVMDDFSKNIGLILFMIGVGAMVYTLNVEFERIAFLKTNHYNSYQLVAPYHDPAAGEGKVLAVNGSPSSYINDKKQGFRYAEKIKKILLEDLKLSGKKILVVGAGGFSLSAEKTGGNQFVYLDIDKDIKSVSKQGFIDQINGEFIAQDGRAYLHDTKARFDVVVSDAYSNRQAIPAHLLTREHFLNIRRVLTDNGVAIFNIIARPGLSDAYSKRTDNTIRSVFANCMAMPDDYYAAKNTNIVYVCRKSNNEHDLVIYTDNLNSASLDFYEINK